MTNNQSTQPGFLPVDLGTEKNRIWIFIQLIEWHKLIYETISYIRNAPYSFVEIDKRFDLVCCNQVQVVGEKTGVHFSVFQSSFSSQEVVRVQNEAGVIR
jgi:hypothetical protein